MSSLKLWHAEIIHRLRTDFREYKYLFFYFFGFTNGMEVPFLVSVHQMAPPLIEVADIRLQLYYSFIDPEG